MLRPCQRGKLAGGRKEQEHTMSSKHNGAIASVSGIDIGKNSFHVVGQDDSGAIHAAKWKHGSPICHRA